MRKRNCALVVMLVGGSMVMGCGDDAVPATVTLELQVMSFEPGEDQKAVPGAEVCVLGTDDCDVGDDDGRVSLQLPANEESAVMITAEGFNPTLSPQVTEDVDLTGRQAVVLSESVAQALSTILGIDYPLTDFGVIAITTLVPPLDDPNNGIPGITYTLVDGAGQRYYLNENGIPQTELAATTAPLGTGGFIEVTSSVYEISLGGTASNCTPVAAWAGDSASSIRLPVEAGFFTDAYLACDPINATPGPRPSDSTPSCKHRPRR
ncbi:MAG: hypothetical protein WBG86_11500 [Polyangiales bacterium]